MPRVRFSDKYISKEINYFGSILRNLSVTMQTKQHANKKTHLCSNRIKIYKGLLCVVEGFSVGNVQNLRFLLRKRRIGWKKLEKC